MINAATKLIGLLGYPLNYTLSPRMQNAAFARLKLDYFFFPIEVKENKLAGVLTGIRNMNFAGFNVTKPHKVRILEHLDELDPLAEKIGSVNTVVIDDGRLIGYNTDGIGFIRALLEKSPPQLGSSDFFIMGAGGASRALCHVLAGQGVRRLYIVDKHNEASMSLTGALNESSAGIAIYVAYEDAVSFARCLSQCAVLVNATGIGMEPHLGDSPMDARFLRKDLFVCDIVYNPPKTKLLCDAQALGCATMNGVRMAVHQGARAFALWTGAPEPVDIMNDTINEILSIKLQ